MIKGSGPSRFHISTAEVKPLDVGAEEGFKGVDSRLLVSDATMGYEGACLFRAVFPPGAYHGSHLHTESDEILYCISGEAIQAIEDVEYVMKAGDAMLIPRGVVHWMRNDSNSDFMVVGFYPTAPNFDRTGQRLVDKPGERPGKKRRNS